MADYVEVGSAAWTAKGVSVTFCATQVDAGVPAHTVAEPASSYSIGIAGDRVFPLHRFTAAAEYSSGDAQQQIEEAGQAQETFNVGAMLGFGYGPPVGVAETLAAAADYSASARHYYLIGDVAGQFAADSEQSIYSTPIEGGSDYVVEGSVAWEVGNIAVEYWVDIAQERDYPWVGTSAGADYFSAGSPSQGVTYDGDAAAEFAAGVEPGFGYGPSVGALEQYTFATDLLANISQQRNVTGDVSATISLASARERVIEPEVGATAIVSADTSLDPPHPVRLIHEEGTAAAVFTQGGVYSAQSPTAVDVEGSVAVFASVLAELAVANLHDALAEYKVYSGTIEAIDPFGGYSEHYPSEAVPGGTFFDESKPSEVGYSQEAEPTLPAGQDGVWTMDGVDGAVTEPPVHGAYTDIGYFKEWKPWWQTRTNEDKPTRSSTKEAKPT